MSMFTVTFFFLIRNRDIGQFILLTKFVLPSPRDRRVRRRIIKTDCIVDETKDPPRRIIQYSKKKDTVDSIPAYFLFPVESRSGSVPSVIFTGQRKKEATRKPRK